MKTKAICSGLFVAIVAGQAASAAPPTPEQLKQVVKPAPNGNPVDVATKVIGDNFDFQICPAVREAIRLTDGSIMAVCVNDEKFRVFNLLSKSMAARCSVVPYFC